MPNSTPKLIPILLFSFVVQQPTTAKALTNNFEEVSLNRRHHTKMQQFNLLHNRGGLVSGLVGGVGDVAGKTVQDLGDTVNNVGGADKSGGSVGDTISNIGGTLDKTVNDVAGTSSNGNDDNPPSSSTGTSGTGAGTGGSSSSGSSNAGGTSSGSGSQGASAGHGTNGGSGGQSSSGSGSSDTAGSGNVSNPSSSGGQTNSNSGGTAQNGNGGGTTQPGNSDPSPATTNDKPNTVNSNSADNNTSEQTTINKAVVSESNSNANGDDDVSQGNNAMGSTGSATDVNGDVQAASTSAIVGGLSSPSSTSHSYTSSALPSSATAAAASDHSNSGSHTKDVVIPVVVVLCILVLAVVALVVRKRNQSRRAIRLGGESDFTPVNRVGQTSPTPGMSGVRRSTARRASEESFVAGRPNSAYTLGAQSEMSQRSYGNGNPFAAPLTSYEPYTDANPLFYNSSFAPVEEADFTRTAAATTLHTPASRSFFESSDSINGYNTAPASILHYDGSVEGSSAVSHSFHGMDLAGTSTGAPQHYSPYADVRRSSVASANSTSQSSHDRHYRIRTSRLELDPYAALDSQDPFADQGTGPPPPQAVHSSRWSS